MPTNSAFSTSPNLRAGLRQAVRGRVWLPGDAYFDDVRKPWNLAVEQPVAAVVEAADEADVAALVGYASAAGMGISTQPNGHGATGSTDGTILLRTGRLDRIEVDQANRRARIGAGVRSGDLQQAAAEYGLTGLPGSSPVVSVTGVALGGGLSWFGRAHGWVADSVTAFDVVNADGRQHHVTAETDPELFWALHGGGGNYAIVTGLDVTLHDAPALFGGRMLWSRAHARPVVDAYRTITRDAPVHLTAWLQLLNFPGADPMIAIDVTYLGAANDAQALLTDLDRLPAPISDTRRPMSVAEVGGITGEPTDPGAAVSRTELLTEITDAAVDTLLDEPIDPLMAVQIRHLGGAFAQPSDGPNGPLTEPYAIYLFGVPTDPATAQAITAKQLAIAGALPVTGRKPATFLNPAETLADALPAASIERLRRLKSDRDPGDLFRGNFGVPN